jgi:hypothetical protein
LGTQDVERFGAVVEGVENTVTNRRFDHQRWCEAESELHQALR